MIIGVVILLALLLVAVYKAVQLAKQALSLHSTGLHKHLRLQDAVLLITAHPDDECMFFAPSIRTLRRLNIPVHVLCLSRGNHDGLGCQREKELEGSCRVLGVNCTVLEEASLQDGPGPWSCEQVAMAIEDFMETTDTRFTILMTFDRWGVSSHPNHRDTHLGVRHFAHTTSIASFSLLELESVPLVAKYVGPLGLVYELMQSHLAGQRSSLEETKRLIALMPDGEHYKVGLGAMRQHASQLVWFRFLYLMFSRYLHINTLYYRRPRGRLSPGWLWGRPIDLCDAQWRTFRSALPSAMGLFGLYLILGRVLRWWEAGHNESAASSAGTRRRMAIALGGLVVLHGLNAVKIVLLLGGGYWLGGLFGGTTRVNVAFTWTYVLAVLYMLEFHSLGSLPFTWIDVLFRRHAGFYARWHVTFNITLLRLISFNMDRYYANQGAYSPIQHQERCKVCIAGDDCDRRRIQEPIEPQEYTFPAQLAYCLYLPLYIAGPIITFNNFHSQLVRPPKQSGLALVSYGARWLGSLLVLELMQHFFYVVAIKDAQAWAGFRPSQFFALAYLNFNFVWLKLLVVWRFFRLVAMLDMVTAPENMARCVSNSYSGLAFWRAWHRSFNQWIVRYLYVPLGGSATALLNIWPIFGFVALWHDFRIHLLAWGGLICLFLLPEVFLRWLVGRFRLEQRLSPRLFQAGCAGAAACNMLLMTVANLVGFVVGVDGFAKIMAATSWRAGMQFLGVMIPAFYCCAQILFEVRATERAFGIYNNH